MAEAASQEGRTHFYQQRRLLSNIVDKLQLG